MQQHPAFGPGAGRELQRAIQRTKHEQTVADSDASTLHRAGQARGQSGGDDEVDLMFDGMAMRLQTRLVEMQDRTGKPKTFLFRKNQLSTPYTLRASDALIESLTSK